MTANDSYQLTFAACRYTSKLKQLNQTNNRNKSIAQLTSTAWGLALALAGEFVKMRPCQGVWLTADVGAGVVGGASPPWQEVEVMFRISSLTGRCRNESSVSVETVAAWWPMFVNPPFVKRFLCRFNWNCYIKTERFKAPWSRIHLSSGTFDRDAAVVRQNLHNYTMMKSAFHTRKIKFFHLFIQSVDNVRRRRRSLTLFPLAHLCLIQLKEESRPRPPRGHLALWFSVFWWVVGNRTRIPDQTRVPAETELFQSKGSRNQNKPSAFPPSMTQRWRDRCGSV